MEFKLSTSHKIFVTVVNTLLTSVVVFVLWQILNSDSSLVVKYIAFLFLSSVACVLVYSIVDAYFKRLVLKEEQLIFKKLAHADIIYWKDVAGYRLSEAGEPILVHRDPDRDAILIQKGWEKEAILVSQLLDRFTNLNQRIPETNEVPPTKEHPFGNKTPRERERIETAQQLTKIFTWAAFSIMIWCIAYPQPYEVLVPVLIAFPIGGVVLAVLNDGLIKMHPDKNDPYPNIGAVLYFPVIGLVCRAMLDFEILHYYSGLWIILGVVAVLLSAMPLWATREIDFKKWNDLIKISGTSIVSFLYVFGLYLMLNCQYDATPRQDYTVAVARKYFIEKKNFTYYIEVDPWGPVTETSRIQVTVEQFRKINPGDKVVVQLSQGQLKTSWYKVKVL